MDTLRIDAEPDPIDIDLSQTGLVIVDMQHDFLTPGGYADELGCDVRELHHIIEPTSQVLALARERRLLIVHTVEGYKKGLQNVPETWLTDVPEGERIGDEGRGGWRKLIWGGRGTKIIDPLKPKEGEIVVRKAGKDAFHRAKPNLAKLLQGKRIQNLLFAGVTTGVCVGTSLRSASNEGFRCIAMENCIADYDHEIHAAELKNIAGRKQTGGRGVFGWVTDAETVMEALENGD